jgi:1,4-dihydroxy-2-naphthoate octaprenyltransferase
MDRDETPIGGLMNPLQPTRQLFHVSVMMDGLALLLSFLLSVYFALGIMLYIAASRLYSYRGVRLKQYPVTGFLTVFIFQGALVYFITYHALHPLQTLEVPLLPCIISSLLIGALYPLTQIYQHEADLADGVSTISYLVGRRGTFVLSMSLFLLATAFSFLYFSGNGQLNHFRLFLLMLLPVVLFFLYWMSKAWKDAAAANFQNSLRMNIISTCCTIAFFITLIVLNH